VPNVQGIKPIGLLTAIGISSLTNIMTYVNTDYKFSDEDRFISYLWGIAYYPMTLLLGFIIHIFGG
jgi:hypothetical protein